MEASKTSKASKTNVPFLLYSSWSSDCRYLELRAKREAPRGMELSLRISDRQINARAHPYDLQHWATRVLPFAVELYFPGRDRALPRLRLRRDFFKYLIDDVVLDTPNSVRATLNVAMVN